MLRSKHSVFHSLSAFQTVAGITAVALVLRATAVILFSDHHAPDLEYMLIAQNLLDGRGFWWNDWGRMPWQFTSLFPPLYVYFCALFIALSPANFLPLYLAQAVIGALGCIPAYIVGRGFFSHRAGLLFAALFAVYPELVFLPVRPVPEFMYVVIVLGLIALFGRWRSLDPGAPRTVRYTLLTGLISGLGILVKETVIITVTAIILSYLWKQRRMLGPSLKRVIIPIAVVIFVVLLPWGIRNRVVQGEWIFMRSAFGLNLWMGNNEIATGTDKTGDGGYVSLRLLDEHRDYYERVKPADEQEIERFYISEATQYISQHPVRYVELSARRLYYLFWFDPTHKLARNNVYRLSYVLLLLLAIPGLVLALKRRMLDPVWPLILLGHIAVYVPTIIVPRYRIVMIVVYVLMAAVLLDFLLRRVYPPGSQSFTQEDSNN